MKRLTRMWIFLESLAHFSGGWGIEGLFHTQTHIFGTPTWESQTPRKAPASWESVQLLTHSYPLCLFLVSLPLHPADSVWHSGWVFYLVGCLSFSLHLVFTSFGSRVCQLRSLQRSLSRPPKSTYLGLLGVLTQPSLIFLFLLLQYLDLDRQSSLEVTGLHWPMASSGLEAKVVSGHLWGEHGEEGLAPARQRTSPRQTGSWALAPDLALRGHHPGLEEKELLRVGSFFLKKLDIELPHDLAISFLHIYSK